MTTTNLDGPVNENPFFHAGLDAWCFGVSTSMLLGLQTLRLVSEAQVRVPGPATDLVVGGEAPRKRSRARS